MKTVDFTQHLLSIQTELFRFAFKLTADREEANDLLQETSLKALDNEEKFTPDTNFKGWMYTIMRNIFIGEFYQFNLSSCIRQQNSLTAQFVSFSLSNLANIFYPPPQFLQ